MSKHVAVIGSYVADLMARASHLPVPGETVKSSMFKLGPGGKGFNQAVAAAKSGANVIVSTKIGADAFGELALDTLKELNVDSKYVFRNENPNTGTALIMVDETTSQNEIMVTLGACETITDEEIDSIKNIIETAEYVLLQLEINLSAIERVINIAHNKEVPIILNPAPIQPISDELLSKVDIITPNEVEAAILTGIKIETPEDAKKAAKVFFEKGIKNVVITLGKQGVYVATKEQEQYIPSYKVNAIDTTGAGDAFNGGFITALYEGKDIWEAAHFGNAVAALSVTKLGTTPSMPTREEINTFIEGER